MDLINSFAIVAYLAGPVAPFVNRLREDLAPGTGQNAHITILPPRPLDCPVSEAVEFARQRLASLEPLEVRLGAVEVFDGTQVIHISVAEGAAELVAWHDLLNGGCFEQTEMFDYAPHVTLAQQLPPESVGRCRELSQRRWQEFAPAPRMRIETLTLVEQRGDGGWEDLAELALGRVAAVS